MNKIYKAKQPISEIGGDHDGDVIRLVTYYKNKGKYARRLGKKQPKRFMCFYFGKQTLFFGEVVYPTVDEDIDLDHSKTLAVLPHAIVKPDDVILPGILNFPAIVPGSEVIYIRTIGSK